jgi:hypothetical protein
VSEVVLAEIAKIWRRNPQLSFGQLVEQIEDVAWDLYEVEMRKRYFSRRLMNLPDFFLLKALAQLNLPKQETPSG